MTALDNIRMISASAGTGKTYRLTGVVAEKIAAGIPASAIMATTFTKKAAGELKERITARLLEQPADGQDGQKLRDAAQQLGVSLIGTVNSVCSRLLTEHAIDAGLSPALEQIDESEQSGVFRLATDQVLADYSDRILPLARRMRQTDDDEVPWTATVRRICDAARTNLLQTEDLASCADRSWDGYRELLEDRSASDDRPDWLRRFRQGLIDLQAMARDGADAAGKPVNTTSNAFTANLPLITDRISALGEDVGQISWEQWRGIIPSGSAAPIKRLFEGPTTAVRDGLLACPAFQDDVEQYIRLVFACVADCLSAYADFKRQHGLMDFVDQETLVLGLARTSESFRSAFRQRVKFLVVDEFQDTSPLQLELFLQLSRLVDEVAWVGDPKQAIYEFRGTDPELMNAVVGAVDDVEQLSFSWRSEQAVINLSNAVFEPVFGLAGMRPETVRLAMPPAHASWPAGSLEAWNRGQSRSEDRLAATAAGVADLLARRPELKPADVAILARTNPEVSAIARALADIGLRASTNEQPLFRAREIQLVRAGMAYVADPKDTVALTEIVALHPLHPAHRGWQHVLLGAADPEAVLKAWAETGVPHALAGLRERAGHATPTEVFEETVHLLGLPALIKSWTAPATRLRNLDAFRAGLNRYYESCKALNKPATLRGSLRFLTEEDAKGADNAGDDVVNVMTYHKAKGLEWPVVVMESLDKKVRFGAFGTAVEQDGSFDLDNPLAERWIRFWPSPFPHGGSPLDTAAAASSVSARAEAREVRNLARLMYVGMTRSRTTTILTAKGDAPAGLNALGVENLISWSGGALAGGLRVAGASDPLPASVFDYSSTGSEAAAGAGAAAQYTDDIFSPDRADLPHPPARIQASKQESTSVRDVHQSADLGERLIPHGAQGWDAVGSAIHAYLGTAHETLLPDDRLGLAKQIVDRWAVGDLVDATVLVEAGDRLTEYLAAHYPSAIQYREVPIGWRNPDLQVMEGWIDLLLETAAGYILIDHKSYPGNEPAEHIRKKYLGQMEAYSQAVLAATGKPVIRTLIHLPALGKVFEVR